MAPRINPSRGSKPDKFLRDALIIELNRASKNGKTKRLNIIAAKLVASGEEGKMDAIREIFDRVEGKPAQGVQISGEDGGPIQITWESK